MYIRTWKTWIVSAVVTAVVAVGAVVVGSQESGTGPTTSASTSTSTSSTSTSSSATTSDGAASVTQAATTTSTPSTAALQAIETDARFAVSVLDVDTGESLDYGAGAFDTASIVKVDILAALLHQHQEAGTSLTSSERALATAMIEQSDNTAATTLFEAVGGETGLQSFDDAIGLTETDIRSDGNWGLTQTTTADQLRLLDVVFGDDSVLTTASQAYEQGLMSNVIDSQRFGVSAAADDADEAALKVGFLQRSATGLWDVTSVGRITAGGHTYLVAVLSDGSSTYDAGVALVDAVAQAAVGAMTAI